MPDSAQLQFSLESAAQVVHERAGPAVVLRGRDALGQGITLCVTGALPRLEVRCPKGAPFPVDEDALSALAAALNRTLAARYFVASRAAGAPGSSWCMAATTNGGADPLLVRGRSTRLQQGRVILTLLLAHPEHVAWARAKLARPLGDERSSAWVGTDVLAVLLGREARELEAGREACTFPSCGEASYEADVMRRAGLALGRPACVADAQPSSMVRYTAHRGELCAPLSALSAPAAAPPTKKGSKTPALPEAPPIPPGAARAAVSRLPSTALVWVSGTRGWAVGSPDAMAALQAVGWRASRVLVEGRMTKGAYGAQVPSMESALMTFVGWKHSV